MEGRLNRGHPSSESRYVLWACEDDGHGVSTLSPLSASENCPRTLWASSLTLAPETTRGIRVRNGERRRSQPQDLFRERTLARKQPSRPALADRQSKALDLACKESLETGLADHEGPVGWHVGRDNPRHP